MNKYLVIDLRNQRSTIVLCEDAEELELCEDYNSDCIYCELSDKMKESLNKLFTDNSYLTGYNILMEYWDSLPDEDKPEIDKRLKALGL